MSHVFKTKHGEMFKVLDEDAQATLKMFIAEDNQFHRRLVARNNWGLIEGYLHAFQQAMLDGNRDHLSIEDRFGLEDEISAEVKHAYEQNSGKKISRHKLIQSIKFTIQKYRELYSLPPVKFSGIGWNAMNRAVKLRSRVIHPKRPEDLHISDDDFNCLQYALCWFYLEIVKCFLLHRAKNDLDQDSLREDIDVLRKDNSIILDKIDKKYFEEIENLMK